MSNSNEAILSSRLKRKSRALAQILRHSPEKAGFAKSLDGFYPTDKVASFLNLDNEELRSIVSSDEKGRYSFSEDFSKIRANQGHSYFVDPSLLLNSYSPEDRSGFLFHGTSSEFSESIAREGLKSMSRQFCHLTENRELATKRALTVAKGDRPLIVTISKEKLLESFEKNGRNVFVSSNGVILVESVPPELIESFEGI